MATTAPMSYGRPYPWRRIIGSVRDVLLVSPGQARGLVARLLFSAVVCIAMLPYLGWFMPGVWMAVMAALAVAEHHGVSQTGLGGAPAGRDLFAWLQSAGYGVAGFYITFVETGAAQTFGVTLYGVVMFEVLARDYVRPRRLLLNLTPMLVSMAIIQSAACIFMLQRHQPWEIATVAATSYLVFRAFRSVQIDLTQARGELFEASTRALADARTIREAHRIALMAETMAGVGHWRVDMASGVTTWSEGVYRIYGLEPSAEVPSLEAQLAHYAPTERDELRARLKAAAATGEPFELEGRLTRADGAVRHVICHGGAELNAGGDRVETMFGAFMDVTEAHAREEALRDAKLRAEAAAEAKAEFLANMSHEIRTPLTAINGYAGLLGRMDDLPPEASLHVRRINSAGETLLAVVNDILDFSKLEAGRVALDPQPFALAPFFDDLTALFTEQARAKGLALALDIAEDAPTALNADADRLRQVVVNLIGNAIKFTDAGEVRVSVSHTAGADLLHVAVSDTGCGVPPDKQARLFQRFSQVDGSASRRHGGAGLGLSICKGLVELMGGAIEMAPAVGGGSIFRVRIAAARAELGHPANMGADKGALAENLVARILVVDDLNVNRELVRAMLQAIGCQVSEADGGDEALRLADAQPFDLILMDLQMPGMDGFAAARAIRASSGENRDTPIIALSADVLPAHIAATTAAGMNGHICKPISAAELIEVVNHWSQTRLGLDATTAV